MVTLTIIRITIFGVKFVHVSSTSNIAFFFSIPVPIYVPMSVWYKGTTPSRGVHETWKEWLGRGDQRIKSW